MSFRLATIALLTGVLLAAAPARAADYEVLQCGAASRAHDFIAASSDPVLYAEDRCTSIAGLSLKGIPNTRTKANGAASWLAFAPAGTTFSFWEAAFQGGSGGAGTAIYARACRDLGCVNHDLLFYGLPEWAGPQIRQWQGVGATMLLFALQCSFGSSGGCTLWPSPPGADMFQPRMMLTDHHAPESPTLTGGTLPGSSWRSARQAQSVAFSAGDHGGGVDHVRVSIDSIATTAYHAPCARTGGAYTRLLPCPLRVAGELPVNIAKLADGTHSFSLATVDAAGQASSTGSHLLRVDNTAPVAPRNATVLGGDQWRASDGFNLRWDVPGGQHAPIVATHWRLCPVAAGPCRSGRVATTKALDGIIAGRSGTFTLQLSLEDAAGNHDPATAATIPLRLDSDPPRPRFEQSSAADPLEVAVKVEEPLSGLAAGSIELRRQGTDTWISLDAKRVGPRLVARIDDERLDDGSYELRATAVDGAGNEASTSQRVNGDRAMLELPVRLGTRLRAGVRRTKTRVVVLRKKGRRTRVVRRITTLVRQARIPLGRETVVAGTLRDHGGNPMAGVDIAIATATAGSDGPFEPAGLAHTDSSGRFDYRLRARRSQSVRLRYAGSRQVRGATADVSLGVVASSTIHASDRAVRNGDTVRFAGRLRSLPAPPNGKLIEMQAYFRERWRTFSTVRTDRRGRWSFDYGFGGTVGTVRYRFRVHIPAEGGYPFAGGNSPVQKVIVRGP